MKLADVAKLNPNAILVHSGVIFDVFNPKIEDIKIIDIAHALSNLCRYGGHTPKFYSVAQHSVICSYEAGTPREQLDFLMHDSTEAYLIDLPSPIKKNMQNYVDIENNLYTFISAAFNLTNPLQPRVKEVDRLVLEFEYRHFFEEEGLKFEFWSPEEAKKMFLDRFEELVKLVNKI